jgi:hypothetical protein
MVLSHAITSLERELARVQAASERAMEAKMRLPRGSSRARVTTANARWATAAERRDRVLEALELARATLERGGNAVE